MWILKSLSRFVLIPSPTSSSLCQFVPSHALSRAHAHINLDFADLWRFERRVDRACCEQEGCAEEEDTC
jgi:hypothetical protein